MKKRSMVCQRRVTEWNDAQRRIAGKFLEQMKQIPSHARERLIERGDVDTDGQWLRIPGELLQQPKSTLPRRGADGGHGHSKVGRLFRISDSRPVHGTNGAPSDSLQTGTNAPQHGWR